MDKTWAGIPPALRRAGPPGDRTASYPFFDLVVHLAYVIPDSIRDPDCNVALDSRLRGNDSSYKT